MFTSTDLDKLHQIMDESPEKKELLQKLLDSQQMTLRTVSHEIRNPLTLVYSTLQLIESRHPEVTTYKLWPGMREDIEYMILLLEDLSSYNNGDRLTLSASSLSSFLKPLVLTFAASLVETEIEFTSRIEPDLPPVLCDMVKLKEVLLNLLRNARDAVTDSGKITLHAFLNSSGSSVCITVADNGCGIAADDLNTVFDPFVTHKQGGTGLGLAISRRIIHAHGGTLTVVSDPGISTSFTVSLPVEKHA